jgi:hypothetical protein
VSSSDDDGSSDDNSFGSKQTPPTIIPQTITGDTIHVASQVNLDHPDLLDLLSDEPRLDVLTNLTKDPDSGGAIQVIAPATAEDMELEWPED